MISLKKFKVLFITGGARRSMASARLRGIYVSKLLNDASDELSSEFSQNYSPGYDIYIFVKKIPTDFKLLISKMRAENQSVKIFYDLCDNYFDGYSGLDADDKRQETIAFSNMVDGVVVPSQKLKEVASRYIDALVRVIPDLTALDPRLHSPLKLREKIRFWLLRRRLSKSIKFAPVLWFGHIGGKNVSGGIVDLIDFLKLLDKYDDLNGLKVVAFSYKKKCKEVIPKFKNLELICFPWSEALHPKVLSLFNYCILPIRLDKFTLVKSSNRFIDALFSQAIVISSPLPSYLEEKVEGIYFFENDFSQMAARLKNLLFDRALPGITMDVELRNDGTIEEYLNLFEAIHE